MEKQITERRQIEEELKESREMFEKLYEFAPDAIIVVNSQGHIVRVNMQTEKMFGYSRNELISQPVEILLPEHLRQQHAGHRMLYSSEPRLRTMGAGLELYDRRKDGSEFPVDIMLSPIETTEGTLVLSVIRGITERKQIEEEALRESEERFRLLVEGVKDYAIFMLDTKGYIVSWNEGAERIKGYKAEEIIGKNFSCFYTAEDIEYGKPQHGLDIAAKEGRYEDEGWRVRKDGSKFWTNVVITALRDREIRGFSKVTRDITERKRAEEERLKLAKLESIGVLAGGIAHDFNNILTAILTTISSTKIYADPEDEMYKNLTEAEKACLRAKGLAQQLLAFSKGGIPIRKVISIGELIKESTALALNGSSVRGEFHISEDLWSVEIDEGQIAQVISNIVINADQAMPQGGVIRIKAENMIKAKEDNLPLKEGMYVKITVEDQGAGIPQEHLSKIFDLYFTTKRKGSGLGLATAYSIIKNHNGYIDVESELGKGTKFYVYIPASLKKVEEQKQRAAEKVLKGKGRVLIMDDEAIIRKAVGKALTQIGYEVEYAKDGSETIDLYTKANKSNRPLDVVMMDLTIPGEMGGKEAMKRLLEINPGVKAIVSSGYSGDPVMSDYKEYGFRGAINKPYSIEELADTLHKVLCEK